MFPPGLGGCPKRLHVLRVFFLNEGKLNQSVAVLLQKSLSGGVGGRERGCIKNKKHNSKKHFATKIGPFTFRPV